MNKKIIVIVVVALLAAGGAYKTVLAKPAAPAPKPKVTGTVYLLQKEFLVNLADSRYAKLTVGLILKHAPEAAGGHEAAAPPEGYGAEPQEAIVRDIITDQLTDAKQTDLVDRAGRQQLKEKILKAIKKKTDVEIEDVIFPDVTVQ